MLVYIYIVRLPYVRIPESTWKILRTQLEWKWSSLMKKSTASLKTKGTWIPHSTCTVNSCQGKDAGVLISIYQHALALDVVQVVDGKNSAEVNSVSCMCTTALGHAHI